MRELNYLIVFILCLNYIKADFIDEFKNDKNLCNNVCTDNFFLLPMVSNAGSVCERGCRFFNIIYLTDGHDINGTRQHCYSSCNEAYNNANDNDTCNTGCDAMSKKKEIDLVNVMAIIEQDNTKSFLLETEIEILESDILSDPVIKNQVELGYNLQYKIPETKIRTMPIGGIIERRIYESKIQTSTDWLECASRNSGIPKSILLAAILVATMAVLIVLASSMRYRASENLIDDMPSLEKDIYTSEVYYNDDDEEKIDLSNVEEKSGELDALIENENEIDFSKPPKYFNETEKV